MATITVELEIDDEMLANEGFESIKRDLQSKIQLKKLSSVAKKLHESIKSFGLDNDVILEQSRMKAWSKFKETHLENILPK